MVSSLYSDASLATFYDVGQGRRRDFDYCLALARGAGTVLDLGCGTGALAVALADIAAVTAADPAAAMLEIARARPGGDRVAWVLGGAETLRLEKRFDCVVMTGHAFQVFLTRQQQVSVLQTIARHLAPAGRFIFDSRNPAYPGRKERDRDETRRVVTHSTLGPIEAWNESAYDPLTGILSYTNGYTILRTGEVRSATEQIRYTPQPDIHEVLDRAGLRVEAWLGDWDGSTFRGDSKDIIPLGRLA